MLMGGDQNAGVLADRMSMVDILNDFATNASCVLAIEQLAKLLLALLLVLHVDDLDDYVVLVVLNQLFGV